MQNDLSANFPNLDIEIVGINEAGFEAGNPTITAMGDLPWLQDIDSDGNGISDVWYDSWQITYRDVFILDGDNELVAVYNLTANNLGNANNYDTLRQIFIDVATGP